MKHHHKLHTFLVGIIFSLFLLQIALQISGKDFYVSNDENRAKVSKPEFHLNAKFFSQLGDYYRDQFALRSLLIKLNSKLHHFFKVGLPNDRVILGKQNWLYYNLDNNIESYRNTNPFSPNELEEFVSTHEQRAKTLADQGILYVYVVGPNCPTIYPEYLPDWARNKLNPESRLDQVMNAFKNSSNIIAVDLRSSLIKEKPNWPVYLNSDTHWNSIGAFIAYKEIMMQLYNKTNNKAYLPLSISDVEVRRLDPAPGGDLAKLLDLTETFTENNDYTVTPKPMKANQLINLTLFRDSFSTKMLPFLKLHFSITDINWKEFDLGKVPKGTKIVIFEQVERTLEQEKDKKK